MMYFQTFSSHLSVLEAYAVGAFAFMAIPVLLAGGATLFMRKRNDA